MPPRRTTRSSLASVESPAPAPTRARPTRSRKAVSPSPEPILDDSIVSDDVIDDVEDSILGDKSVNVEEEDEDEEDVSTKGKLSRKGGSSKVARVGASSENVPVVAARKAGTKTKANTTPVDEPSRRRSARLSMSSSVSGVSDDFDDPPPRATKSRIPAKKGATTTKKKVVVSDDNEEEEEDADNSGLGPEPAIANSAQRPLPTPSLSGDSATDEDDEEMALPSGQKASMSNNEDEDEAGDITVRMEDDDASTVATPVASPVKPSARVKSESSSQLFVPVVMKPQGPKPRLTIHKLVLVNFKSYQGRQEIGPFHKSFSAIVGPNGSGKSNTIDALLFVFGYRASKMRQGKLSELIHNSAGFQDLDTCSVEVWFREIIDLPGDKYQVIPNSQIIVARTAYKNNSSKYTINDKTSSFTEVTTLLKGKGIDLDHKRFLILQGEVESIAQMKPKAPTEHEDGLLEYLEDIIGTSKYKAPIEEAQVEVDALNEARGEKMNRLRLVEKEKSGLEAQKREAEDFLRNTNDLTRKKSMLWQFHMYTLRNNIEITTKTIELLNAQLAEEQAKNAGNLAEIDQLQAGYNEKLSAFDEVKHHMDALIKDSKKFEKEEVGLAEKKKHLVTKQKKLKKSIVDDGHARSEAAAAIANLAEELDVTRNNLDELEHKLVRDEAELEEVRDSLKGKTDEFTNKIEVKQRELEPWAAKISEKKSAIDVAESERKVLATKATALEQGLERAKSDLAGLKENEGSKREQHASLKKERDQLDKDSTATRKKLATLSSKSESIQAKVSASRQKAEEAKASLSASKSENSVLSTLNMLREQGRLKGYHGRLGDLGVIDDRYDVAVTTAVGRLNNIVVDTVEQGQACMEHLRKANAGRANIICLDKLPVRDFGSSDTPEGVPRLFDLIKPKDSEFAVAFYFAMRDTLVANDMEQAKRISYGKRRWRVVTLQGGLIETSGTMSGGGTRVMRGGMSSKFSADKVEPEVVARYERESADAEQEMTTFQQDRRTLESECTSLEKRIPEVEMALEKVEMDLQTSGKRIKDAEQRLKEAQSQSKPDAGDEKRIKQLEGEIATQAKELEKLHGKASAIETQIKELQDKILEVGGVKLLAMQSKVTNTKSLINIAGEKITKAEVGQAKAERDAEKLEKTIASSQSKLEELESELDIADADLQSCTADLETIRAKVQEAQNGLEFVQDDLAEAKEELDGKTQNINAFRALEMDIKQKLEDNARIQKESKVKFKHWQNRHDELELVHVDEEDEDDEDVAESGTGTPAFTDETTTTGAEDTELATKRTKPPPNELEEYSDDELHGLNRDVVNAEITELEEEISRAKPNLNVLAEYRKREAEFLDRAKDMDSVTTSRDAAKARYDDLRKTRLEEFMTGFSAISSKLKEMYQMITLGGNAELELVDSMDPFSEGIIFSVMPPKKSWKNISNLSGGEKTLSSLALVFALHVFKPTPLYFMDEIDAALDFRNVSIIANYIKSKTEAAQFIIISLRNDMFELSHRLVGIYKTSNCTKSIAIDNKDLRTQALKSASRAVGKAGPSKTVTIEETETAHVVEVQ